MNTCTVFAASHRLACGSFDEISSYLRDLRLRRPQTVCIVIDDQTGLVLPQDDAGNILATSGGDSGHIRPGPGRPRLGVVAREITLLPGHWDWLASQPGSISITLRQLVDKASQEPCPMTRARHSRESCLQAMHALAACQTGFDEAVSELIAGRFLDAAGFIQTWAPDIREYLEPFLATAWNDATRARNAALAGYLHNTD